ncbi:MAG: hypothetical protein Cons2KO_09400 [Congregibacter sp.]
MSVPALAADSTDLALSDAWVRAMPPTQKMTAAYFELGNRSAFPISVTAVSSPLGDASLHETQLVDGRSTMRPVETLRVATGTSVALKPGGLHVMLMGLDQAPQVGDIIEVCVSYVVEKTDDQMGAPSTEACIDAPVRRGPPTESHAHGHH